MPEISRDRAATALADADDHEAIWAIMCDEWDRVPFAPLPMTGDPVIDALRAAYNATLPLPSLSPHAARVADIGGGSRY